MAEQFDAVVIGAGALGASTAWHLSRAGRRVVLLDRHAMGSQTSPRAAGLSAVLRPSELMTRLALRGVEKLLSFLDDTGIDVGVQRSGSLKLARSEQLARQLDADMERGRAYGVEVRRVSPSEARDLMPFLQPQASAAITYYPNDVYLDPARLTQGYAAAAAQIGCTLLPHTEVCELLVEAGIVAGVHTICGVLRAPVVVDAAGAWLRGVTTHARGLPMLAVRHQLLVTEPLPDARPGQPITRVLDANVYVRPCDGGLMLGGYESDPMLFDEPPYDVADVPLDAAVLKRLADQVAAEFPVFQYANTAVLRAGLPTMTVDDEHIVGPVPDLPGFYVIGGCNVGGLSTAPALGEALCHLILDPSRARAIASLLPERVAGRTISADELRAACHAHYAQHYRSDAARATG